MLYVLFQLGKDRYALEAQLVVEVVPLMTVQRLPQAPKGVAGMIVYRGQAIPVVDLCEKTQGQPARERMSTRIIIVNYRDGSGAGKENAEKLKAKKLKSISEFQGLSVSAFPHLLGLMAERATEMLRRDTPSAPSASTRFAESRQSEAAADEESVCSPTHLEHRTGNDVNAEASVPRPAFRSVAHSALQEGWLGPVLVDERGVIQLLLPQKLLAEKERELLGRIWPVEEAGSEEGHKTITEAT